MMYCIVDIETTGGNSRGNRITEIAIYKHDGQRIVEEYQTLINPECRIPYNIVQLTGITDEMVKHAPRFYEVARDIVEFTKDSVFVAHNCPFDYNFVRSEFRSLGYEYERPTLCTVRTSRKLLPGHPSYSLGKLCRNLGIDIHARHRAAGDALATVKLFEILLEQDDQGLIHGNNKREVGYNSPLPKEVLDDLPDKTGVYYMHDSDGQVIYVGKSKKIRSRIISHLNNYNTKRSVEMMQAVHHISTEVTGSELVSLLLESSEIKKLKPKFNRAQRRASYTYGIYRNMNEDGYIEFEVRKNKKDEVPLVSTSGSEDGRRELEYYCHELELCQGLCGLYKCGKGCLHFAMKQCRGAGMGLEEPEVYNERAYQLSDRFQYSQRNMMIVDKGRHDDEWAIVLIENGSYQGFGYLPRDHSFELIDQIKLFVQIQDNNRDVQNIIQGYIRRKKMLKIVPL
jgi:DNA polymerase-3 subunit epsilon